MVFSLSALCWRRIRGFWKLPGWETLKGKLGLVLTGEAMLSKSLIQFSVDWWRKNNMYFIKILVINDFNFSSVLIILSTVITKLLIQELPRSVPVQYATGDQ